MEHFDIFHVEDESATRSIANRIVTGRGLTYFGVGSLQGLEEGLKSLSAGVFVVDGEFPEVDNGRPSFLAPRAIDMIRSVHSNDAKIVLYSGAGEKSQRIADENGVHYLYKGGDLSGDIGIIIQIMESKNNS